MLLAAGREVVSKTSAYNITKLSYRAEVRVGYTLILPNVRGKQCASSFLTKTN